jgi:hypothetical protein
MQIYDSATTNDYLSSHKKFHIQYWYGIKNASKNHRACRTIVIALNKKEKHKQVHHYTQAHNGRKDKRHLYVIEIFLNGKVIELCHIKKQHTKQGRNQAGYKTCDKSIVFVNGCRLV